MKTLRSIGIAALILAGIGILGLGYYGFVPGLSRVLGSANPRDLKIEPTAEDLESAKAGTGIAFGTLSGAASPEESLRFSGKQDIASAFTDGEITALLRHDNWRYNFIEKGQLRFNADGTQEISGLLRLDRVYGYALAHRIPMDKIRPYVQRLEILKSNPAFYMKVRSSWSDNKLSMELERAEIGRFELPKKWLTDNGPKFRTAVETHVLNVPELTIRSLTFTDGRMHFEGTFPQSIEWAP